MRRLFRWLIRTAVALVMLLAILVLAKDALIKEYVQWRIRRFTGFDASIERLELSLLKPTVLVHNLRLYNPSEFGSSTFVFVPELRFEYDPAAVARRELHFRSVTLNLAELNLVKNAGHQWNLHQLGRRDPAAAGATNDVPMLKLPAWFTGIDTLTFSAGIVRQSVMDEPGKTETLNLGITNRVVRNVKSEADLVPLLLGKALEDFTADKPAKPKPPK